MREISLKICYDPKKPGIYIGQIVRAARSLAGLQVKELAKAIGITRERLGRIESGQSQPDIEEANAIATATGQDIKIFTIPNDQHN